MARALGRSDKEIRRYAQRSQNYRQLFDKSVGLMRGRNQDGSWHAPFNPFKWGGDFTEGNSWHYTWSVFHDVQGLMNLMGGKKQFLATLDTIFALPPAFDESYYGGIIHEIREMQVANMGQYGMPMAISPPSTFPTSTPTPANPGKPNIGYARFSTASTVPLPTATAATRTIELLRRSTLPH